MNFYHGSALIPTNLLSVVLQMVDSVCELLIFWTGGLIIVVYCYNNNVHCLLWVIFKY